MTKSYTDRYNVFITAANNKNTVSVYMCRSVVTAHR